MRDTLPDKVNKYECGIINLGSFGTNGTHWICYYKNNEVKYYFVSYGNLIDRPVKQLVNYLGKDNIYFNDNQIQEYTDPPICGYLCVYVLKELNKNVSYKYILYKLTLNKNDINLIYHKNYKFDIFKIDIFGEQIINEIQSLYQSIESVRSNINNKLTEEIQSINNQLEEGGK